MDISPDILIAQGWRPQEADGFSEQLSPFWMRKTETGYGIGIVAEKRHCNTHIQTVHGGVVMTFADIALGYPVARALGHSRCVTVHLHLYFTASPKLGQFISCEPEITRQTKDLFFVRGLIRAGERTVASAEGMWKVLEER